MPTLPRHTETRSTAHGTHSGEYSGREGGAEGGSSSSSGVCVCVCVCACVLACVRVCVCVCVFPHAPLRHAPPAGGRGCTGTRDREWGGRGRETWIGRGEQWERLELCREHHCLRRHTISGVRERTRAFITCARTGRSMGRRRQDWARRRIDGRSQRPSCGLPSRFRSPAPRLRA